MKKYLLPRGMNRYKVNLHCHSTFSDGRFEVAELKRIYLEKGYSAVAFSDHNVLLPHPELASEDFVPITATEINVNGENGKTYHLNFYSTDPARSEFPAFERIYGGEEINALIKLANENGFLAQYNHPRWSYQSASDYAGLKGLWGFEVYNHGCEHEMHDGWGDYEYEVICRDGKEYPAAVATDDNHNAAGDINSPYDDSFGGWTSVFAPELTYTSLLGALKNRDCYATTGPEINALYVEDGKLHIECTPVCAVLIRYETRRTPRVLSRSDDIREAAFELQPDYVYLRVELKDTKGNKAMTRAYLKSELE
ncbi:MAG: PHP domain-containing protein [Clostridia bacterium]|nr:PHP domain-containing protein [Clostridia bacterium]